MRDLGRLKARTAVLRGSDRGAERVRGALDGAATPACHVLGAAVLRLSLREAAQLGIDDSRPPHRGMSPPTPLRPPSRRDPRPRALSDRTRGGRSRGA